VQAWGRDSDRATVVAAMADMPGADLRPQLGRIHAPTLVMGSRAAYKDVSTLEATRAIYVRQYRDLGGMRIAMAAGARHFIMLDDPAWFDATLAAFLS
jgi:N-formylmaleamate deformylase